MRKYNLFQLRGLLAFLFIGFAILLIAAGCGENAPTGFDKPAVGEKTGSLQKLSPNVVPIFSSLQLTVRSSLFLITAVFSCMKIYSHND